MKKAVFLRVSKKELNENTQLPVILQHFKLMDGTYHLLQERKSGYKKEVQQYRISMNKLIALVENEDITEIYVYSLERLYRNIDWLLEFYFKCRKHNVKIYSYLQPEINNIQGDTPVYQFLQLISVLISGFMGMNESFLTSNRTKKAFIMDKDGNKISYKGNKLGRKMDLGDASEEYINECLMDGNIPYIEIIKYVKENGGSISKSKLSTMKKALFNR